MNTDFPELLEKRKLRKFRLYVANLVYQWFNIGALLLYLISPFAFKVKVGPFTYFLNLIFIPLFSTMLYYSTRDAIKNKVAPVRSGGSFIHRTYGDLKDLMPSIFALAQWMTVAVFQKDIIGNYSWLIFGSTIPLSVFVVICSYCSTEHIDNCYNLPPKKLKETGFKLYVKNLFYQWSCLVGLVVYMVAPIVLGLEVSEPFRHLNLVLIPVLTVVLYNQTRFAIETKTVPKFNRNSKIKYYGKIISCILPSVVAMCEWGSPIVFMNNSLGVGAAIIISALLPMFFFIIMLCCISDQDFEKEIENE